MLLLSLGKNFVKTTQSTILHFISWFHGICKYNCQISLTGHCILTENSLIVDVMHSVEKREILSHEKMFRQINSLVKPLLSRNFCKKSVRKQYSHANFVSCFYASSFLPKTLPA